MGVVLLRGHGGKVGPNSDPTSILSPYLVPDVGHILRRQRYGELKGYLAAGRQLIPVPSQASGISWGPGWTHYAPDYNYRGTTYTQRTTLNLPRDRKSVV